MARITKILNIVYYLTVLLLLLDSLTSFNIKNQALKSFVYFGVLIGTFLILVWNLLLVKTKTQKIIWATIPTLMLTIVLFIGPMKILFSIGAWRTQTILYQNDHISFKKVEFQMQDVGALGYNDRTVEVLYLTPLFIISSKVPSDIEKKVEWKKIDKDVNELGLIFP